ncbi:MAG TPA: ABC transporter [Planctomycetes bacterium]|nr:ABC transporter [Planctomycetota bacterium]
MDKRLIGLVGGVIATILYLAVNLLGNQALGSTRFDLTEEKLFTLSDGSRHIAESLDEPVHLYLYYSEAAGKQIPGAPQYHQRVRDVLREYADFSDGKILLEEIDPEPFSEEEDEASANGVTPIPTRPDPFFFGLVGTNSTDDRQVIPFFGTVVGDGIDFASRERFLEYDISRLLYSLAHPERKRVGVLSSLPIEGNPGNPMMGGQGGSPRWAFLDQVGYFYELVMISTSDEKLPEDLDVLLVVHPREISETLQYAIDQYVLGGGRLVAFVDPHCEADEPAADPTNPMARYGASRTSSLNRLFDAWGFHVPEDKVVGDEKNALGVRAPTPNGGYEPVQYVVWLNLDEDNLNDVDPVTSPLQGLRFATPGSVQANEGSTLTIEPLVTTSEDSMEIDVGRLRFRPDPKGLLQSFVSGKKKLTLAARISGDVNTAFPDGPPKKEDEESSTETEEDTPDGFLTESVEPIQIIVVADVDMLQDQWWLQRNIVGGLNFGSSLVSDNCDLLVNAIDNLTGGKDLISIRARGRYSRPFERVEEIRREAQRKFQAKEEELKARMRAADQRIAELQKDRDPSDPNSMLFLTPEQTEAFEQAMRDRSEIRKELRDVQHSMEKDIERLGLRIKAINIAGVPLLVSLAAVLLGIWRIQRRGTR